MIQLFQFLKMPECVLRSSSCTNETHYALKLLLNAQITPSNGNSQLRIYAHHYKQPLRCTLALRQN